MTNLLKTLICGKEISLTLLDATEIARETVRVHRVVGGTARALVKTLIAVTLMSASLKDESGKISASVRGGKDGLISVSGDGALHMRGCVGNPAAEGCEEDCFGRNGTLTVVREDGYARPFVGVCASTESGLAEDAFEAYYRESEQIFTRFALVADGDGKGGFFFAGGCMLQALPGASEKTLSSLLSRAETENAVRAARRGLEKAAERFYSAKFSDMTMREATYKCNCSRKYLSDVLLSLGREELLRIVEEEGEVKAHCHYCNTDYAFSREDVEELFRRGGEKNAEETDGAT